MLQVELDGDGGSERGGDRHRQAGDDEGQRAEGDVHRLMQRMADKAVQAVEAADAVMDGMKLP